VKEQEEGRLHEEFKRACCKARILIVRDLPGIDWVQEQGKDSEDKDFRDLVQHCYLTQFVDKPNWGSAVLDLLLRNNPKIV